MNGYSLRHTMSRELRKRRVPAEQIELMLGHAPHDPDYCSDAAAAVEAYMAELQKLVSLPIVGPRVAKEKQA